MLRFAAIAAAAAIASADDKITNLPGLPAGFNSNLYAGYLEVNPATGKRLFYFHAESLGSPSTDPITLWLNGGPGCSSLIGMWTENGPFALQADGTMQLNPYTWLSQSNMVWLEAPVGVGFSYSDTAADYSATDASTAADNLAALLLFFQRYPSLAGRPFYIAGESYGGHYVPTLAQAIAQYNLGNPSSPINLAGFAVGNGLTQESIDFDSPPHFFAHHALCSWGTYQQAMSACANGTLFAACSGYEAGANCPPACSDALNTLSNEVGGDLNPYDVIGEICTADGSEARAKEVARRGYTHGAGLGSGKVRGETAAYRLMSHIPFFRALKAARSRTLDAATGALTVSDSPDPWLPCIDDYVVAYLNRADVQAAIHTAPLNWTECTGSNATSPFSYAFNHSSMLPIYDWFATAAPQVKVIVYSGDQDSVLPFLGTQWDMLALNRQTAAPWQGWTSSDGQPAGYVQLFSHSAQHNLTFITVKGAGHMVPGTQPAHALDLFKRLLA